MWSQINMPTTSRWYYSKRALVCSLILFSGCGWQLRGVSSNDLHGTENDIKELNIISDNRNNPFYRAFRTSILKRSITLSNTATLSIQLSNERLLRRPLAYSRAGLPAQYELTLSLEFQANESGTILVSQRRIDARRNYDFNADLIIEKDQEEQELLTEMRVELANRILSEIQRAR